MRIHNSNFGRTAVKSMFAFLVLIIAIDTLPLGTSSDAEPFLFIYRAKCAIRPVLRPLGLWQAEWRLFAPDPIVINCWWTIEAKGDLSADLRDDRHTAGLPSESGDEGAIVWNSPYWREIEPAKKFFKRRHIAYARRLSEFPAAVEDFADFWVRERLGDRVHALTDAPLVGDENSDAVAKSKVDSRPVLLELSVFRNELKLAMPDDGSLPTREETVWLSVTEKHLQRRYGP